MNQTDLFLKDIEQMIEAPLSKKDIVVAKNCLLDYLGVAIAGAMVISQRESLDRKFFISEPGNSTVIGFEEKASLRTAAMVNGMSAHVIELDDGHRVGMLHPGAPVISALLPLAEQEGLSEEALLRGIIIGYESAIRLACAVQPAHKRRGYHATGTCGTVGAAIGIAAALGYSKGELKGTLSAAVTSAAGVLEVIDDNSELKPYNVGRAAADGIAAACIGRSGFAGPEDIIGGKRGLLSVLTDESREKYLFRKAEEPKLIEGIYLKPYAACRHCHAPIEAILNLKKEHNIQGDEIDSITVRTYDLAVGGHDHNTASGSSSAKMSIPYSVAIAAYTGSADIDQFSSANIEDNKIASLALNVQTTSDDGLSKLVPEKRAAVVEITMKDKACYKSRVDYPKGEPENPLTAKEIQNKFLSLAMYGGRQKEETYKLMESVLNEKIDIRKLLQML